MKLEFLTHANIATLHTLCTDDKPEFASANTKRANWLDEMFAHGLRGWIAFEDCTPLGYVEYMPLEVAPFPVAGRDANFLSCLWVVPKHRHHAVGGSLLAACLADSPRGVATLAYRGERKPATFFERYGFRAVDQDAGTLLMLSTRAQARLERRYLRVHENANRLAIDVLYNPECPHSVRTAERVIAAVEKHPARCEIDLWIGDGWACGTHQGMASQIYFNGRAPFSAPPSDGEIERAIADALTVRVPCDV